MPGVNMWTGLMRAALEAKGEDWMEFAGHTKVLSSYTVYRIHLEKQFSTVQEQTATSSYLLSPSCWRVVTA